MRQNDAAVAAATRLTTTSAPGGSRRGPRPQPLDIVTLTVRIERRFLPATRDALNELREKIGTKMQGAAEYAVEDAWVYAQAGVSALSAAVHAECPQGVSRYAR